LAAAASAVACAALSSLHMVNVSDCNEA
jgi:hypothetical protein